MSSYHGPGLYYIKSVAAGTAVDLLECNNGSGVEINCWSSDFNPTSLRIAQVWRICDVGSGEVIILNNATGSYIHAPANSDTNTNGTVEANRVRGGPGSPSDPLNRWMVQPQSDGSVVFRSVAYPKKVLDLDDGLPADHTAVQVYTAHLGGNMNQFWICMPAFKA